MPRRIVTSLGITLAIAASISGASVSGQEKPQQEMPATEPREPMNLFNGKDLSGLKPWLKKTGRDDPQKVFSVRDGVIHVSGDDHGYLATDKAYKNYHLIVECRWGKKTDGGKYVRNSGVLLHGTGPDGGGRGTWMASIECQGSWPNANTLAAALEVTPRSSTTPDGVEHNFADDNQFTQATAIIHDARRR